jgi:hypothetical protein
VNQPERHERKKQLIAQGALHRAALCAERQATSQALQPRALAGTALQQVAAFGLGMLRDKASRASPEAIAGERMAGASNDVSEAMLKALVCALPSALPAALPVLIRTATTLVQLGRAAGLRIGRKTLVRGALVAGVVAGVTAVVLMRKRKVAARTSASNREDSVAEPIATTFNNTHSPR